MKIDGKDRSLVGKQLKTSVCCSGQESKRTWDDEESRHFDDRKRGRYIFDWERKGLELALEYVRWESSWDAEMQERVSAFPTEGSAVWPAIRFDSVPCVGLDGRRNVWVLQPPEA